MERSYVSSASSPNEPSPLLNPLRLFRHMVLSPHPSHHHKPSHTARPIQPLKYSSVSLMLSPAVGRLDRHGLKVSLRSQSVVSLLSACARMEKKDCCSCCNLLFFICMYLYCWISMPVGMAFDIQCLKGNFCVFDACTKQ